jgi:FkbM family methyltransferase
MGIKRKAQNYLSEFLTGFLKKIISITGGRSASRILAALVEDLSPYVAQKTNFGTITFFCPGKLPELRAQTLLTKEPGTLKWIETFENTETLWDIGANVGVYSLYAGIKGHTVLSFEPSPANYYLLSRNIEINKLDNNILAYCIAFNDITKLDTFFMANTKLGGSLNSFGEAIDWQGNSYIPLLKQAMVGYSVDDFVRYFNPPFPNHIKLDVDGIEGKIVKGAKETLGDNRLKSVLVELDTERQKYVQEISMLLEGSGLKLVKKERCNHIFAKSK